MTLPTTFGGLDQKRYAPRSVRQELRQNLIDAIRNEEHLFPGVVGYARTVIPQLINAVLAKHDIILLGLRGQAKTRLARLLPQLLDEWRPFITDSPLREHPLAPITQASKDLIAEHGPETPISWLHRDQRYGEKLATPDVSVADLIGDVDPLKAAHRKLDLSDEEVIHYGIIPRTNSGIFCINELPDLAPRIQVALLNLLEEQDIQIRGFPLRIPLDVMLIFTANPEDYTNRGSIITPLKDRIASQISTHYPTDLEAARRITDHEAWLDRGDQLPKPDVPDILANVVEDIAFHARTSEYIDQKSGVSARLSIAARELLSSQVERRLLYHEDDPPIARLVDLLQLGPAIMGKVELVYEGEQEGATKVAHHLIGQACQQAFDQRFPAALDADQQGDREDPYARVLNWFAQGNTLDLQDDEDYDAYITKLSKVDGLIELVNAHCKDLSEECQGIAMELIIEGLHQHSLLSKNDIDTGARYGDMLRSMMGSI